MSSIIEWVSSAPLFHTSIVTQSFVPYSNFPALTTIFTYASECQNRWVLPPLPSPRTEPFAIFSTSPRPSGSETLADYLWTSCQPLKYQSTYSPGICPEDNTMGSVLEVQYIFGGSTVKRWSAQCCQSGSRDRCKHTITTPVRVFVPFTAYNITTTLISGTVFFTRLIPQMEYIYVSVSGGSTSTISSVTTLTTAIAYEDGLHIMWEISDLPNFPPAYATSLAKLIGVSFTPAPSPGSSSSLVQQTSLPPQQPNSPPKVLSTAAKAGIGVGAVLGFLFLLSIGIALLLVRRRRKRAVQSTQPATSEMEDQDATLPSRKWYLGGRWRSEAEVKTDPGELDSRAVHVVPGPPAELDGVERERDEQRINTTERERN